MFRLSALAMFFFVACGGSSYPEQFKSRAAFEMECPLSALKLTYLEDDTWGVSGCGKRAVYQKSCSHRGFVVSGSTAIPINKKCAWVRVN